MVYFMENPENPIFNGWFMGTPILRNLHVSDMTSSDL